MRECTNGYIELDKQFMKLLLVDRKHAQYNFFFIIKPKCQSTGIRNLKAMKAGELEWEKYFNKIPFTILITFRLCCELVLSFLAAAIGNNN